MMHRVLPTLRTQAIASTRSYSTGSTAKSSSNLAPILLGAGLVGAGAFYLSTSDQRKAAGQAAAAVVDKAKLPSALSSDEFRNLKLESVKPYNHNTSSFTFSLPEGTSAALPVASCIVVKSATEGQALTDKGKPAIRPYTPVTAPATDNKLELLIKKYPGGVMGEHIFSLKPGDELAFRGPNLKFPYEANQFETVAFIGGGSGVTPLWQIAQAINSNPSDKTKTVLVFGNVTEEDILLRKEWEDLAAKNPEKHKNVFVLDKPPSGWTGPSGYISQKVLAQALPGPAYGDRLKIFVCGPPGQVNAVAGPKKSMKDQGELQGVLADMGYTADQVYKF